MSRSVVVATALQRAVAAGRDPSSMRSPGDWAEFINAQRLDHFAAQAATLAAELARAEIKASVERATREIDARVERKAKQAARRKKAEVDEVAEFARTIRREEIAMSKKLEKESARRKELRKAAEAFGLSDEAADSMSDTELADFVRKHVVSDGHGGDPDDGDKAAAADLRAMAGNMTGAADDCPVLQPGFLARLRDVR